MEELGAEFALNIQRNTHRYLELFSRAVDMIIPAPSPQVTIMTFLNVVCQCLLGIGNF